MACWLLVVQRSFRLQLCALCGAAAELLCVQICFADVIIYDFHILTFFFAVIVIDGFSAPDSIPFLLSPTMYLN